MLVNERSGTVRWSEIVLGVLSCGEWSRKGVEGWKWTLVGEVRPGEVLPLALVGWTPLPLTLGSTPVPSSLTFDLCRKTLN